MSRLKIGALAGALVIAALGSWVWWRSAAGPSLAELKARYRPPGGIPFPADNPFVAAKADLGRLLFFDKRLSGSGTTACATCHIPDRAWTDGRAIAVGDSGHSMARRAPTLIDTAWNEPLGWDGRFPDIEAVTFIAITGDRVMNLPAAQALARVAAVPDYVQRFSAVFADHAVSTRNIAAAIATFERLIVSRPDTPFDRWIAGDEGAISPAAARGFVLFNGRARCAECHSGWAFTDGSFHDIGIGRGKDTGRGRAFPTSEKLQYAFKVPTLRNVAQRPPYMHDGSLATLPDVIDLYDRGGIDRPSRADQIRPLHLTATEKADLLAFLDTLSGPVQAAAAPMPPQTAHPLD